MLKHENPHIEVLNKNLWAVRFSLIPFMSQISYKPDPEAVMKDSLEQGKNLLIKVFPVVDLYPDPNCVY